VTNDAPNMFDIHLCPFLIRGKHVITDEIGGLPKAIVAMMTDTCPDDQACCIYQSSSYHTEPNINYSYVPQIAVDCKVREPIM